MSDADYTEFKKSAESGVVEGANIYERPGWDMVELKTLDSDVLPYICTKEMAEKVRVRC